MRCPALSLILLLLAGVVRADVMPLKQLPQKPAWAAEFAAFDDIPLPIDTLASQRPFRQQTFLVEGWRPEVHTNGGDNSSSGTRVAQTDWVLADESGEIDVTGLLGPAPGRKIVLAARFSEGVELKIHGIRWVAAGSPDRVTRIRVGDFVRFPSWSGKSSSTFPEFSGDLGAIESFVFLNGFIVQGVRAGEVTVRILEQFWDRREAELRSEVIIAVESR